MENHNGLQKDGLFDVLQSTSSKECYPTYFDYLRKVGEELCEEQPFYTFDLADILWKDQLWREKFPNIFPYYAVKANADPVLIRLFVLLGYGFDCSTTGEIRLVLNAGADPRKIIFAHTVKPCSALKYASSVGVDLMTVDSEEEIHKIHKYFPDARLIIRVKSDSKQKVYNLSRKYGCTVSEAEKILLLAKQKNMNIIGTSFHAGGLCDDPKTYTSSIEKCRSVFDVAKKIGFDLKIVDIGAGFFGSRESEGFFHKLTKEINASLKQNFPDGAEKYEFIAEPGCYCVASAVTITTTILGKRTGKGDPEERNCHEYYLNDGYYNSFFGYFEIYDENAVPLLKPDELNGREVHKSKLWGQTCCAEDVIREECQLPDMEEGEFIVFENSGAYNGATYSNFTQVPYPANRYVYIKNPRINMSRIPNIEQIKKFIKETAVLVEEEYYGEHTRHLYRPKVIHCNGTS